MALPLSRAIMIASAVMIVIRKISAVMSLMLSFSAAVVTYAIAVCIDVLADAFRIITDAVVIGIRITAAPSMTACKCAYHTNRHYHSRR